MRLNNNIDNQYSLTIWIPTQLKADKITKYVNIKLIQRDKKVQKNL